MAFGGKGVLAFCLYLSCQGVSCRQPWTVACATCVLTPLGSATSLPSAMSLFSENMCWTVLHEEFTAESVYPRGLLLVCRTSSVCEFVEQFPFLTLKDIKPIAEFHSGFVSSSVPSGVCRCPLCSRVYSYLSVALVRVSTAKNCSERARVSLDFATVPRRSADPTATFYRLGIVDAVWTPGGQVRGSTSLCVPPILHNVEDCSYVVL
ncbi:hypothetical protein BKA82DRAFT_403046 [Pisolithus tinctorius]|uniref:Secreted protein n=1 Tax=Pisolithus tinctorius Marx 270 TaxID=870435 RepID=A0A0C3NEU4_PISTI|nr:hypothetical protein BKA82DRAFT_403046 [Pisolithus tinctorius]KIN94260.1 hypothetical protein M404DRAFT_403046 [Pisolithus tinctorius Marx 270]